MATYNLHATGYLFIMEDVLTPQCPTCGQASLSQGRLCVLADAIVDLS